MVIKSIEKQIEVVFYEAAGLSVDAFIKEADPILFFLEIRKDFKIT